MDVLTEKKSTPVGIGENFLWVFEVGNLFNVLTNLYYTNKIIYKPNCFVQMNDIYVLLVKPDNNVHL